ncbi:Probable Ufm1-specific protease 2 [Gryllus bimaculatus]|nr:Probable Ufm1-specific protease 2 [Gryllus bimaculatus]
MLIIGLNDDYEINTIYVALQHLGSVRKTSTGCLFGLMYESTLLVVGYNIELCFNEKSTHEVLQKTQKNYKSRIHNLPTEVDLCGLITFAEDIADPENHATVIKILEDVDVTDNPLLMMYSLGSDGTSELHTYFYVHDKLVETPYDVVNEATLWQEFIHVRLCSRLPLVCDLEHNAIKDAIQSLHKKVASGTVAFCFLKSIFLLGGDVEGGLTGVPGNQTVGDLFNLQLEKCGIQESNRLRKHDQSHLRKSIDIVSATLLMKPTREIRDNDQPRAAPVIQHIKKTYTCLQVWLHVDALSMVPRSAKLMELYPVLVESVCRNLKLTESCLLEQVLAAKDGGPDAPVNISLPKPLHFLPADCSHFLTLALPEGRSDDQLVSYRKALHMEFGLPQDRPFFRKGNAYVFRSEQSNKLLVNPHEGLGSSGVKGGEVSVVQGLYSYHHYMQDRIDDDGWGCAYRSLQTIVSWFRWQGYTARDPPSHHEIQECLVKLGDKPPSFIGSSQWIGSTEVSYCLEAMLGITSRIISVSSGEELGLRGGELAMHFRTQGTPIMIGGGVLAHTILGVDFNRDSGDLKFLILDPHYTGGEDLTVVQNKGWCGWKGINFWKKGAFYNLCLPQRPIGI